MQPTDWRTLVARPSAGLWVDKTGATIVLLRHGSDPLIRRVESGLNSRYRVSGGWRAGVAVQEVSDEKRNERRRQQQLKKYFDALAAVLEDADQVLILGPGEAKLGLVRTLRRREQGTRRVTVQTADRMTERQLVAAVRKFFCVE
jgi:hypothetical protein